jgi:TPP-dependent indolepyruvate ferredoxin oxidoreductase alpha subunit
VLTESSIPQTAQKSIWVYFRLARGTEAQTGEVVQNGKLRQKTLHYCVSCSNESKPNVWHTVYTSAAQRHVKTKHKAQWKKLSNRLKNSALLWATIPARFILRSLLCQILIPLGN